VSYGTASAGRLTPGYDEDHGDREAVRLRVAVPGLAAVLVLLLCTAHVRTRIRRRRPGPVDAADPGDQPAITVRYEDPFSSEAPADR
jgi:hypothetical protein